MDHQAATQLEAVDKYLLNELPPHVRDEFEEHYFDCQECSTDLRATVAFMDAAEKEFKSRAIAEAKPVASAKQAAANNQAPPVRRSSLFWRPAVPAFALAASLLVIAYQNVVVFPGYQGQIAQLQAPEILPTVSLIGANSRGASSGAVAIGKARRIQLVFDIPTQDISTQDIPIHDRFAAYACLLYAPSGAFLGKTEISAQAAKDTVTMDAPTANGQPGTYRLLIQGQITQDPAVQSNPSQDKTTGPQAAAGVKVQEYSFTLTGN